MSGYWEALSRAAGQETEGDQASPRARSLFEPFGPGMDEVETGLLESDDEALSAPITTLSRRDPPTESDMTPFVANRTTPATDAPFPATPAVATVEQPLPARPAPFVQPAQVQPATPEPIVAATILTAQPVPSVSSPAQAVPQTDIPPITPRILQQADPSSPNSDKPSPDVAPVAAPAPTVTALPVSVAAPIVQQAQPVPATEPAAVALPPAPQPLVIEIGRIDIRLVPESSPATAPRPRPAAPVMPLADYLSRRDGGAA